MSDRLEERCFLSPPERGECPQRVIMTSGFLTVDVYHFIVQWALAHKGNTPSQRQIGEGCGFSGATAHYHIHALMDQGLLERIDGELCVARIKITAPDDIYDEMKSVERTYPGIEGMRCIPKEVRSSKKDISLAKLGIETGDAMDEEFLVATYPEGWHYLKASGDEAVSIYLLRTAQSYPRATLSFDRINYKASIYFWG